jgi:hypothetical protein
MAPYDMLVKYRGKFSFTYIVYYDIIISSLLGFEVCYYNQCELHLMRAFTRFISI